MKYTEFETYPLTILGIDESYDAELTAIENFVKADIAYTGDMLDLVPILPYFVFHAFCESRRSEVSATNGEHTKVSEFTVPSYDSQKNAWNIGVKKLVALCILKGKTVNCDYLNEYSLFGAI